MRESDHDVTLQIAQVVPCTEAEGPGRRFAIWFQGCPLRCPECCNPQMLSFEGGTAWQLDLLMGQIAVAQRDDEIGGITLLGGEPFAHAAVAAKLAKGAQQLGLTVMIFSGYEFEEIQQDPNSDFAELLQNTDILVDGPYLRERPDTTRRWIGSANQRIHFLTDKYRETDTCWQQPDTLEIRLADGELNINGFPAKSAVGIWKRPGASH
mgnify:CR=1 FL=1